MVRMVACTQWLQLISVHLPADFLCTAAYSVDRMSDHSEPVHTLIGQARKAKELSPVAE